MQLDRAVQLLRSGGLVAFPTETVYGLGADATNADAVRRVFAAKGRPGTNPLIVHVADAVTARRYARIWPDAAEHLARRFWPGPLTLVLHKSAAIAAEVSAGLDTVGLRAPDHPLALQLLSEFGGPLAAPSANRSNRVSPTTAQHVACELGNAVDLILDGGPCAVGIESTVLDLTCTPPRILRPGAVTRDQIERVIGPVEIHRGNAGFSQAAKSPGQQPVHYSPSAPAFRFGPDDESRIVRWCAEHPRDGAVFLLIEGSKVSRDLQGGIGPGQQVIAMPHTAGDYAARLYAALHDADAARLSAIFIELPPDDPSWAAVRDRLQRATRDSSQIAAS